LVCGIYVDLNQIRAGEAATPEGSTHTSGYERIRSRSARQSRGEEQANATDGNRAGTSSSLVSDDWLCELSQQQGPDVDLASLNRTRSSRRASEKGLLPVSLDDYLAMLDWTGRQVRGDKRGSIPRNLAPILDRLAVNVELWVDLTTHFDRYFGRIVGPAAEVAARASRAGRRFYRGQATCAAAFG
jgi:hypothetical protein